MRSLTHPRGQQRLGLASSADGNHDRRSREKGPGASSSKPTPLRRLFPVSPSIMNRMITRPAGFRCDLDDLLLSFLLSLYDRFAAWASITAGAAEDPLWVDYCRLPD